MLQDMDREWMARWTGAQHLAALRRHIVPSPGVIRLDRSGYAAEILATTEVPEEDWNEQFGHALVSALRPEFGPANDDGAFVTLHDGTRIRMGDCSWSDRVYAAREAMGVDEDDDNDDDKVCPIRVAERVLAQVLELAQTDEPRTIDQLDAPALVQLASAILDRYDRALTDDDLDDFDLDDFDPTAERVRMVLTLHRSLGRLRIPPHSPPRKEQQEPRWPPRSRPPETPLMISAR